jgi:hypothetical protein
MSSIHPEEFGSTADGHAVSLPPFTRQMFVDSNEPIGANWNIPLPRAEAFASLAALAGSVLVLRSMPQGDFEFHSYGATTGMDGKPAGARMIGRFDNILVADGIIVRGDEDVRSAQLRIRLPLFSRSSKREVIARTVTTPLMSEEQEYRFLDGLRRLGEN